MSRDRPKLSPALPPELERAIFETAAHIRPLSIPRFMLVAWRVKIWLEPLLYQTVVLSQRADYPHNLQGHIPCFQSHILLSLIQSKSVRFPGGSVRNLFFPAGISTEDTSAILSACRSVENLWMTPNIDGELFSLIEDLQLSQLYCNLKCIFGSRRHIDFTHRLFAKITHLEIFGHNFDPTEREMYTELALLPHLTHLCFNDERFTDICLTLLKTCKSLRVLVILERTLNTPLEVAKDPRFVVMYCNWEAKDWRMGAHSGIDYWSRAEEFIAKRRSGEIDPLIYTIEGDASEDIR